jgi:hypothetical protein
VFPYLHQNTAHKPSKAAPENDFLPPMLSSAVMLQIGITHEFGHTPGNILHNFKENTYHCDSAFSLVGRMGTVHDAE